MAKRTGKRADVHTTKLKAGHYSHHDEDGGLAVREWYAMTPNGILTHLGGFDIEEHEDGTITVYEPEDDVDRENRTDPPLALIQATTDDKSWKGYLERGVWTPASA